MRSRKIDNNEIQSLFHGPEEGRSQYRAVAALSFRRRKIQKVPAKSRDLRRILAEKEGFEPTVPYGTDALQAPAFDHSATSPHATANIISQLFKIAIRGNPIYCWRRRWDSNPRGSKPPN